MSRRVFYDPFGQRLAGLQAGINDEVQLQQSTRQARQSDYQYNVTQPLELRQMQRADQLGQYTLPYQMNTADRTEQLGAAAQPYAIKNLDYNDQIQRGAIYDGDITRLVDYGQRTGDWGRLGATDDSRYAPTSVHGPQTHAVDSQRAKAFDEYQSLITQEGLHPGEHYAQKYQADIEQAYGLTPGSLLDPNAMAAEPQAYETTPGFRTYQNPVTGEVTHYPGFNPESYRQYGFYKKAQEQAQQRVAEGNLGVQQGWQRLKAGAAGADGADGTDSGSYFDGQ